MKPLETLKNELYGMEIRLKGLIRRGASQEQLNALRAKHTALKQKIETMENA